ncbi:ectoine hydrolase DoeA [Loktanella sp. IMCC34160]|uniref:ectoine hydrolase DoeA n=1 Tax=Loktanella sp. IMCC34160 TaxID=2510646 RepID=UPI00101BDCD9|nr:ectoine hydrolase DoeA [Loktanella sp. IMCC34160]RYG92121.1 ectoine hydrolase DoeA [Loktanella sp. IMCC34160]
MANANPAFTNAEYQERIAKTRAAMDKAGVDLILVTDPSNMAWLTGYDGWSFYVHQGVLLGPDGDPIWWGRGIDGNGARRTVFMSDDHIRGYEDSYVQNPSKHPMEDLSNLIREMGWDGKTLGVEMDNYYFSASCYTSLLKCGANKDIADITGMVNWQRAVKSATEIDYMRKAARIVEAMHATIREKAEPGLKKNDLVAEIYSTAIKGVDGIWGDYPAIVPMAPSGLDATAPHLTWDDQPMKAGEATFFEITGVYRRYHCPQSRTLFLGKPPQKYLDAEKAVADGTAAVFEVAKPGNLCEDIANAFNAALAKHGFLKDNRCGYAIGLSYPPDWGERTMSFRAGDKTVLKPGMTFHFMPALWLDDGGIETTEPILITETGFERLADTPAKLVIKD